MRSIVPILSHFFFLSVLLSLSIHPAYAHKLQMFITIEALALPVTPSSTPSTELEQTQLKSPNFKLVGQVYYSASSPLADAEIKILSIQNELLAVLRSDKDGRFQWPLTTTLPIKVQSHSLDGHLVERIITPQLSDLKATTIKTKEVRNIDGTGQDTRSQSINRQNTLKAQEIQHIISSELTPLKEQISKLHNKIWLLEILGGLGILFGGFGIWMFFLSKQTRLHDGEI